MNGKLELSVFCAGIIQNETMIEYAVAYCGLDCGKCDAYLATINDDQVLREKTAKRWVCDSLCAIRQCALKKDVMTCGDCPDMESCQTVGEIIPNCPEALGNLKG